MKTVEFFLFVGAMVFYIRHLMLTNFIPHPIAFGIWLMADTINYFTYTDFSGFWVGPAIMPLGALTVVIIGIVKRKKTERHRFKLLDWVCIGICAMSLLVWAITQNAIWSNMIIQIIIALGFVPIIGNLFKKQREPLFPWFLFAVGWIVTCVDTYLGYKSLLEFVYPIVNGLLGCVIVLFGSWMISPRRTSLY